MVLNDKQKKDLVKAKEGLKEMVNSIFPKDRDCLVSVVIDDCIVKARYEDVYAGIIVNKQIRIDLETGKCDCF